MNIAIIPARGGSKRIPKKNIKDFLGKPIIAYSIEAAFESKCFDKVVVSTDNEEIARVAKEYGAEVPFIRPSKLSGDYVETMPVIEHALRWFDEQGQHIENVCCLYATAPFVQARWIQDAYIQLEKFQADGYCFSATSFAFPIQRAIKVDKEGHVNMFYPENFSTRSQDVEEAYHDAGQFYWGKASAFKQQKPFFSKDSVAYILPRHLVQDIDTQEDWYRAELMYKTILKEDI